jgi:hypothetical protein
MWDDIWVGGRSGTVALERDELAKESEESVTIFQQDNTKIHVSRKTQRRFETLGIWVLDWHAYLPDIKPH